MKQLTKAELQGIELKEEIAELQMGIMTAYTVVKIECLTNQVKLQLLSSEGKRKGLTIASNFNKEGDRQFHSKDGELIVKYFRP